MMWARAAESMVSGEGWVPAAAGVLHERAMRHFGDGMRQYLVVRLARLDLADEVFREVQQQSLSWPKERFLQPPGAKAQLYALARQLADHMLGKTGSATRNRHSLPWKPTRAELPQSYIKALTYFRTGLSPSDAELLELYFVRELAFDEIAFVVARPLGEIESEMARLIPHAQQIAGDAPPSRIPGLAGALIEAFALGSLEDHVEINAPTEEERAPLRHGTLIGGRYAIDQRMGIGSFGDVYRANDTEVDGHVVALKILHHAAISEKARAAALRELRLIASVFHPSIVLFKDHGWFEERLWFVMPWYHGETLEARIARQPLTRFEARQIFEPLARALAAMHAVGVRHQDIKPENIFLAQTSGFGLGMTKDSVLPVLLDLGVAATEAEVFLAGTPMYFAPEVAAPFASAPNRVEITGKADIFSLALALRNSLEPQTQEEVEGGAVEAFVQHRVGHVPALPQGKKLQYLHSYFEQWLAVDPNERPTAEEFADQLSVLTRPEERRARAMRTLRWLIPSAAAMLIAFGAVVMVLANQAEIQKYRAQRARTEAAQAKAGLSELTADINVLQEQYQNSRWTRQQLATKLAETEGEVKVVSERLDRAQRQRKSLQTSLDEEVKKGAELSQQVYNTRLSLEQETAKANRLRADLTAAQGEVAQLSGDLQRERQRVADLGGELSKSRSLQDALRAESAQLRRDVTDERNRARDMEAQLKEAQKAQRRLEREAADLRRQLDRQAARGGGASAGDPLP
ncbi:MAG: protein kinase [Myxococcales bacterium]|nr:protein kinase [Myxococcales bacterium]MCB9708248.1 protein kinase [Myxococcales bacterium]